MRICLLCLASATYRTLISAMACSTIRGHLETWAFASPCELEAQASSKLESIGFWAFPARLSEGPRLTPAYRRWSFPALRAASAVLYRPESTFTPIHEYEAIFSDCISIRHQSVKMNLMSFPRSISPLVYTRSGVEH